MAHLGKAANHDKPLLEIFVVGVDRENGRPDCCNHGGVSGEYPKIAFHAWNIDPNHWCSALRFGIRKYLPVRRDEAEMKAGFV
jgi:hypothetical protein